jgi:chromosomal replication initiation ATPase DnaA
MNTNLIYPDLIRHFIYNARALNYESKTKTLDAAICECFEIPQEKLYQHCRKGRVVDARRLYFYILNKSLNLKPPEIAERTGFDRCTIMYHNKKTPDFIETEKNYREKAEGIIKRIKSRDIVF